MKESKEISSTKQDVQWLNVLFFLYLHMSALYGFIITFTRAHALTTAFALALILVSTLSVTLGCHRLWCHKAYRASTWLKLIFAIGHTLTCQGPIYDWILDHRLHHKYHGTELDPYNHKNGFFFAQLGNKLVSDNPGLEAAKRNIDMTDIEEDSIVMWQKSLYWFIMPIMALILPINTPVQYWGESLMVSIFVVGFFRIAISLHYAWLIHSATLLWGLDPEDRRSIDTGLIFVVNKSLWPQYHYILPWDYQSGEYGNYKDGFCNAMLRIFASLGLIYDLRTVNAEGVRSALYKSTTTKKPLLKCLEDEQTKPSFDEMIADIRISRKFK